MWQTSSIPFLKGDKPLVMAHRGNSADVPENTAEAFEDAASIRGVDVIESDVYFTADGEFVFFHDPKLDRTTDGHGKLEKRTLAELKALDAGFRFELPDGSHPFRGKGFRIQALEEILPRFSAMRFNLDIKSRNIDAPAAFARKLDDLGVGDRVLVASFWKSQIVRFRAVSDLPTSASTMEMFSYHRKVGSWLKKHSGGEGLAKALADASQEGLFGNRLPFVALQIPERIKPLGPTVIKGPPFVALAHAFSLAVHVWTIDEPADMNRLLDWGIDGIFTNAPSILVNVMKERGYSL
jgi:glycerophosphoryl diester phosphodiesterase